MAEFFHRLKLIIWKNLLLRRRHKKRTVIEILWPLMLFLILMWVRTRGLTDDILNCHTIPKTLPSVGGFEFLQNTFCSLTNPCFKFNVEKIDHWNSSLINKQVPSLEKSLTPSTAENLAKLWAVMVALAGGSAAGISPASNDTTTLNREGLEVVQYADIILAVMPSQTSSRQGQNRSTNNATIDINKLFCGNLLDSRNPVPDIQASNNNTGSGSNQQGEEDPGTEFVRDPDASPECNKIFQSFAKNVYSALIWKTFKIYARGVIYFTPDNSFTRSVMTKVEEKIKEAKGIESNVNTTLVILRRLQAWEDANHENLELVKIMLRNPTQVELLIRMMGVTDPAEKEKLRRALGMLSAVLDQSDIPKLLNEFISTAENVTEFLKCVKYDKIKGFPSERQAVAAALPLIPHHSIWAVVSFKGGTNGGTTGPDYIEYKIRMDTDKVDNTFRMRDRPTNRNRPRKRPFIDLKYVTYGFAYMEEMIERALTEIKTGVPLDGVMVYLQQFPFPCYIHDEYIRQIAGVFPLFMILSWLYAAAMMIKYIVYEKENHLKEMMKMVGLSNFIHWLGWFIDSFVVLLTSATILCLVLKYGKVLTYSDFSLLWFFMLSYTITVIAYCFLMSTFFNKANSAAAAGGIMFFLTYMPYGMTRRYLEMDILNFYHVIPICLFSNVALGFGCNYFAQMEYDGVGASWERLNDENDTALFELRYAIIMLWFDSFLYLLVALYVEAIFPGSGVPKPWYFLFLPSTYIQKQGNSQSVATKEMSQDFEEPKLVEPVPEGLVVGVRAQGLSKTYSNGNVALKSFTMDFYQDQITSFLGHNGAGKTTTISILTGLFPPTKGTAEINGFDITKNLEGARRNVGVCPQYNTFFDKLTVSEHITFFSGLKGKEKKASKEEIDSILADLGIPEKRDEVPHNLSGGMKRKLCVAIAFSGDAKTVFLDEPTSGVDPFSRRSIWELLLKYKKGRTIILTTHFMDEADILGDRIAIISRGTLKTCGSSLYLKNHFGEGYSLHLVRQQKHSGEQNEESSEAPQSPKRTESGSITKEAPQGSNTKAIVQFVKMRIPKAVVVSNVGTELAFILPYSSAPSFPQLFNDLDAELANLNVSSYGISDPSLEDVFLAVIIDDLKHSDSVTTNRCCCDFFLCKEKSVAKTESIASVRNKLENQVAAMKGDKAAADVTSNEDGDVNRENNPKASLQSGKSEEQEETTAVVVKTTAEVPANNIESEGKNSKIISDNLSFESSHINSISVRFENLEVRSTWIICMQTRAILLKRFINSKRSLRAVFFEIVLPIIFIAVSLLFTRITPRPRASSALEITPYQYPTPLQVFFSVSTGIETVPNNGSLPIGNDYFSRVTDGLTGPIGFSTECLNRKIASKKSLCKPKKFSKRAVDDFNLKRGSYSSAGLGKCSCSSGNQLCNNVERKSLPFLKTHAEAIISDASKIVLPDWLLNTYFKYYERRLGGYELDVHKPYPVNLTRFLGQLDYFTDVLLENNTMRTPPDFQEDAPTNSITIWFDNKAWISSIAYLNGLHNIFLRDAMAISGDNNQNNSGISLFQHPLDLAEFQLFRNAFQDVLVGLTLSICVINALSYVPASFVLYLIQERACGGKHLHLVSGVKPIVYWFANFIYDMTKYLIPVGLAIILFLMFNVQDFISKYSIFPFICLLVMYGWATIPLMYPASHIFAVPSTAFVVLACTNIFLGVTSTVSEFVLARLPDPDLQDIGEILRQVYVILPQYCLGRGMINLVIVHTTSDIKKGLSINFTETNRFQWDILGKFIFCLFLEGIVFFIFDLIIEYRRRIFMKFFKPKPRNSSDTFEDEDEDVHEERQYVMSNDLDSHAYVLVAQELTKFYPKHAEPAVNGLTFAIGRGECFGLLGINGAGKTSTFKMLTGDVLPSGGKAMVSGQDVVLKRDEARKHLGYCPQEDGLDLLLNAFEVLDLYASLRGMKSADRERASNDLIETLGLGRYALQRCGNYSGGNKRKLSTALAMIGDPDVIFLDEPTSGMDPAARRQLWGVILFLIRIQKSVILTTHSMEECEALCSRVGIMVNGRFECFGSIQHLKNRFGSGYMLTVRCLEESQESFFKFMEEKMPYANLISSHCSQVKFNIAQGDAKLNTVFELMQSVRQDGLIEDYSVSQTTLDDIFVKFASHQKAE